MEFATGAAASVRPELQTTVWPPGQAPRHRRLGTAHDHGPPVRLDDVIGRSRVLVLALLGVQQLGQGGVEVVVGRSADRLRRRRSPADRPGRPRSAPGRGGTRRRPGRRCRGRRAARPTGWPRPASGAAAAPGRPGWRRSPPPVRRSPGPGVRSRPARRPDGIRCAVAWVTTSSTQPSTSASIVSSRSSTAFCSGVFCGSNSPPSRVELSSERLLRVDLADRLLQGRGVDRDAARVLLDQGQHLLPQPAGGGEQALPRALAQRQVERDVADRLLQALAEGRDVGRQQGDVTRLAQRQPDVGRADHLGRQLAQALAELQAEHARARRSAASAGASAPCRPVPGMAGGLARRRGSGRPPSRRRCARRPARPAGARPAWSARSTPPGSRPRRSRSPAGRSSPRPARARPARRRRRCARCCPPSGLGSGPREATVFRAVSLVTSQLTPEPTPGRAAAEHRAGAAEHGEGALQLGGEGVHVAAAQGGEQRLERVARLVTAGSGVGTGALRPAGAAEAVRLGLGRLPAGRRPDPAAGPPPSACLLT